MSVTCVWACSAQSSPTPCSHTFTWRTDHTNIKRIMRIKAENQRLARALSCGCPNTPTTSSTTPVPTCPMQIAEAPSRLEMQHIPAVPYFQPRLRAIDTEGGAQYCGINYFSTQDSIPRVREDLPFVIDDHGKDTHE